MLKISALGAGAGTTSIVHTICLCVQPGHVHVIMGPNGAGKSSLLHVLMGDPVLKVSAGTLRFEGNDLAGVAPDERARMGMFLTLQNPVVIPGLCTHTLLVEAMRARLAGSFCRQDVGLRIEEAADELGINRAWLYRSLESGFSGGERKRLEMLHVLVIKPKLVLLDEIDSGLDVDVRLRMAEVLNAYRARNKGASMIVVGHHRTFLEQLRPDCVHVMKEGAIVRSGAIDLIATVHEQGYDAIIES